MTLSQQTASRGPVSDCCLQICSSPRNRSSSDRTTEEPPEDLGRTSTPKKQFRTRVCKSAKSVSSKVQPFHLAWNLGRPRTAAQARGLLKLRAADMVGLAGPPGGDVGARPNLLFDTGARERVADLQTAMGALDVESIFSQEAAGLGHAQEAFVANLGTQGPTAGLFEKIPPPQHPLRQTSPPPQTSSQQPRRGASSSSPSKRHPPRTAFPVPSHAEASAKSIQQFYYRAGFNNHLLNPDWFSGFQKMDWAQQEFFVRNAAVDARRRRGLFK